VTGNLERERSLQSVAGLVRVRERVSGDGRDNFPSTAYPLMRKRLIICWTAGRTEEEDAVIAAVELENISMRLERIASPVC